MRKWSHAFPVLTLVLFCLAYTWLNMSQRLFVTRFGCGCPRGDGSWCFNTNDLTMVVIGSAGLGAIGSHMYLVRRVPEKFRMVYMVAVILVVDVICLFIMVSNFWL